MLIILLSVSIAVSAMITSLMTDRLKRDCSTLVNSDWAHKRVTSPLNKGSIYRIGNQLFVYFLDSVSNFHTLFIFVVFIVHEV